MVDSIKDISFDDAKKIEDIDKILQENLHVSLAQCAEALAASLQERAEEYVEELVTVAPHGDYGKLIEEPEAILKFLKEEAYKPEHWIIEMLGAKNEKDQIIEIVFQNKAIDDGDMLKGYVFVGLSGAIRHAFPQVH
jgi:hypothetical protein